MSRSVVRGEVRPEIRDMHRAVCEANAAGKRAAGSRITGEAVPWAATGALTICGCTLGPFPPPSFCSMPHGTGHGVGLDVHGTRPLDLKGPELFEGDAVTIEPSLYRRDLGGVRVEDIVVVTKDGCVSLNRLPEGLTWT
jgi:Xaa-Pro aminopeptidase